VARQDVARRGLQQKGKTTKEFDLRQTQKCEDRQVRQTDRQRERQTNRIDGWLISGFAGKAALSLLTLVNG